MISANSGDTYPSRSRAPWVGSVLALVFALASCSTDIQSGIDSANDLLWKKQYVASERLFHKLLKRLEDEGSLDDEEEAQHLVILDRLGKINALYLHDYQAAIAFYDRLVQRHPKTEQAFAARAMVADIHHNKLGKLEAAVSEYQKMVAEFPSREETRWAQLQIARAFFELKNYDQARTEAETLINRWPDTSEAAQARFQIANSYYVQGRYTEAIATYERLLEGEPEPQLASLVMFELGNCFQELEDPDRALAYYYACLSDHPNPMLVQRKITRVRTRLHRTRPAEDILLPEYVRRRLASAKGGGRAVSVSSSAPQVDEAPEERVYDDARRVPAIPADALGTEPAPAAPPKRKKQVEPVEGDTPAPAEGSATPEAPPALPAKAKTKKVEEGAAPKPAPSSKLEEVPPSPPPADAPPP